MDSDNLKLSINLLPVEITRVQATANKYYKLRLASTIVVLTVIFLSSTTLALRLLQGSNIKKSEASVAAAEGKVSKLKSAESSLVILKNRLANIDQIISTPSKQRDLYNLITTQLPPTLAINSVSLDRSGSVTLSLVSGNTAAVDDFLSSLLSKDGNKKISSIEIESFSRGRDGVYRVTLKIKGK